jgi:eukaryotic-like serine/threonine-protein kinase
MDSTRWSRIQAVFHGAADLPKSEQRGYVESACAGDEPLMTEVLALLGEDAQATSLLDRNVADVANEVFDDDLARSLPFKEFGPYRIIRGLGEGGMGVVYLAERTDLRTMVAIKILRDAWVSPARRERFSAEQRTLAHLNHPSIARLYDANTLADGTPWFVMEYVEGTPLIEYANRHRLSLTERLKLFRAVCEAVQYAHGQAVIHRDLKPSNILVKNDGSVRLLDFGIAKHMDAMDAADDRTRTGLRLMTPAYAAPEQIRGDRVGVHTDVYSLGVILYVLLAGKLPFDLSNQSPAQAEAILTEREPEKPSALVTRNSRAPGAAQPAFSAGTNSWADLDVLCLTAMHKDPERRYRSVEALIRDVDHFLKAQPLEARPDTLPYRLGKFLRRNRNSVSAAAIVFIAIVGLVIFYTVRLTRARNAALAEAARTQRVQRFMQGLFQGGDEAAGPADDLRVVTLLDRGAQLARTLDADPPVQADLYQTLATSYQQIGKYDQADALYRSALEKRKSLYGSDSAQVAETLVALALLRRDQGNLKEAESLSREGLAMTRRHLLPLHPAVASASSALGQILVARGEYAQAIPILEEAYRLQSVPGEPVADLATTMTELANALFYTGHYVESDSLNRRILEMDRKTFGANHPNVAEDLSNLASIQYEWGHFAEAEKYDRQALEIAQAWWGRDHPETSSFITILGRAFVAEGKLDEAGPILHEALAIQERVYGKVQTRVASTLNELGKLAVLQGKLDEGEADFTRALNIWMSVYNGKHYYIGTALANLGGVSMQRRQYAPAESYFSEALKMYSQTLPPEHKLIAITRIRLGRALLRQNHYAEAESQSRTGYLLLTQQPIPPQNWLTDARTDLVQEYEAMHQPLKAAYYRAALAIHPRPISPNQPSSNP